MTSFTTSAAPPQPVDLIWIGTLCQENFIIDEGVVVRGHVDKVKVDGVSGWVLDPTNPARRVAVRLQSGNTILASTQASLRRTDVASVTRTDGNHGFEFPRKALKGLLAKDLKSLIVEVQNSDGEWSRLPSPAMNSQTRSPQYQSFDDAKGASKSSEKLAALQLSALPNRHSAANPLQGLSVLDLGCNEGFFCGEALRQGAKRVVGIDANKDYIERAKKRFPDADFQVGSWWDIPNEKFDVILFLSAIHYEWNQRQFLDKLATHLTPTGTLILECGVGQTTDNNWHVIQRGDGIMRYPNFETLSQELLSSYAWRYVGSSVQQVGDPISRSVLHCQIKKPTALLIAGTSGSGKSIFALELKAQGISVFHIDGFLKTILEKPRYEWSPVAAVLKSARDGTEINCRALASAIMDANLTEAFVDLVMLEAFLETNVLVIEGEILEYDAVTNALVEKLNNKNIKVWSANPR